MKRIQYKKTYEPGKDACFLGAEDFMSLLLEPELRDKVDEGYYLYKHVDVLAISNIQKLFDNSYVWEMLNNLLIHRVKDNLRTVLSCDKSEFENGEADIPIRDVLTRFKRVNVMTPDYVTKRRVAEKIITEDGTWEYFDEELIDSIIADSENIRCLIGNILRVVGERKGAVVDAELIEIINHIEGNVMIIHNPK